MLIENVILSIPCQIHGDIQSHPNLFCWYRDPYNEDKDLSGLEINEGNTKVISNKDRNQPWSPNTEDRQSKIQGCTNFSVTSTLITNYWD
jgi:hypothetical protein